MPSKKQQRRRQKLKRHEYEEVYVDEEGNELAPEVAEELVATTPTKNAKQARAEPARRGGRSIEPPSWRRTGRRTLIFFPLMLLTVFLVAGDEVTTVGKIVQTLALMAFFLPFSYFMDTMVWRAAQRRLERPEDTKKR
jgi:cytochrome c-type biogenesis protein CcmH/NrfG